MSVLYGYELRQKISARGGKVSHLAWSPDGSCLVGAFSNRYLKLWQMPSGEFREKRLPFTPTVVAWSPDGNNLLVAAKNAEIQLLDATTLSIVHSIAVDTTQLISAAWGAVANTFNLAQIRGTAPEAYLSFEAFDLTTGEQLQVLTNNEWSLSYPALSSDRSVITLSLTSDVAQVWDLRKLSILCEIPLPHQPFYSVALSPKSDLVAIAQHNGAIVVWSIEKGDTEVVLYEHEGRAYSTTFSADNALLASKAIDNTVRLWDCTTWEMCIALTEKSLPNEEPEIIFSPKEFSLATYDSGNTTIRIWDIQPLLSTDGNYQQAMLRLTTELEQTMPRQFRHLIEPLVRAITYSICTEQGVVNLEEPVTPLLRELVGQRIPLGNSIISFGEHNSIGDVTLGDVAGNNIIKITVNIR